MRTPLLFAIMLITACSHAPAKMSQPDFLHSEVRVTEHRNGDDLLSAGLGLAGLQNAVAPAPVDAQNPTAAELRRRAIHASWRGIADLAPGGGYGSVYGAVPNVPGREFQAFAKIPAARQPHRVLAQIPDGFDRSARCLVVAPSSGSRGVYGAISVAAAWALPKGCAVVYTDKGTGAGYYDLDERTGVLLDGTRSAEGVREFDPGAVSAAGEHRIAVKHAHSQDNPEADWGRHVLQAARFGLQALDQAFPELAPFTASNTRIIATAVSNGGGAVLRASEQDSDGLIDAVVAGEPNILAPTARPLYDYSSEAALYQPCILGAFAQAPALLPPAAAQAIAAQRCASLHAAGLLTGSSPAEQSADALARLRASGWSDNALQLAGINMATDLWRSVVATYAQAYARAAVDEALCGYSFALRDASGAARAATAAERALWWSDGSGVASVVGIGVIDGKASGSDPALPGLLCARELWSSSTPTAQRLHAGIEATRATARPHAPYTLIIHGVDDGLIPIAFTSQPYVAAVRAAGGKIALWQVPHAQHFDAFLGFPSMSGRYLPLLPYVYAGLDQAWAHLLKGAAPPDDRSFDNRPRGADPLAAAHLGL